MASNDRDIWVAIVSGSGEAPELSYLTYAIYSFEKYEWYNQIERVKGKPPTLTEINDWISQITEIRIKAWKESAARTFDLAARTYMRDYLLQERREAINDKVIKSVQSSLTQFSDGLDKCMSELRKSGSFGKQLFVGFVIAILSPIILGLLILAIQAADLWPTATDVTRLIRPHSSETAPVGPVHNP